MNQILSAYLASQNYERITRDCVAWIRDWFAKNGPESPAVIGISGGKDSSTVAALCVEALGKDRVIGILMPNGEQPDIDVSKRLVAHLGIKNFEINIHDTFEAAKASIEKTGTEPSRQMILNLPPRLRMATLYAISQCYNGRVSNNCNRSENYVGYSSKFGDDAGDFSPLWNLTVNEVLKVGSCIGLPQEFIQKPPSDGLTGKTDEDVLGFTYEALDTLILTGVCEDADLRDRIEKKHAANLFKLLPMPRFVPEKA